MASADRLIEIFTEAKARPAGAERDQFLSEACREAPELEEQVLALLQAHDGAGDYLKNSIAPSNAFLTEKPGDRIGRYKLLEQIGEGGCGVVYMAEQEEPVRRRVALKVIKLGMDTKSVIARFEAERQALALMDHPNIDKVLDAGATDTGRPYFVMELVRGIKITDYCDQNHLSTGDRLILFTQVCQAIQHAHQKGVIHRDIKPSNILVTQHDNVAVPKVIDFGLAKATSDQRLTDKTLFTAFEQFVGTPAYMSPEQAQMSGLDIDTRTDIYALGVLLYELLTGQTPFDAKELMSAGLDAMRRIILEQEPARPSTRLTQELVAADVRRLKAPETTEDEVRASSRRLLRLKETITLLRGDLDWIVMKALEKDRTRRYETANGLAADIQRHLDNQPVVARPPSAAYRFQKMVRRNKLAFVASTAVIAALVMGLGISTWMFFKEKQARQRAVAAEQDQARLRRQAEADATESRRLALYLGVLANGLRVEQNAAGESTLRESLAMWMRILSKEHPEVEDALTSLAQVLQAGKFAKADKLAVAAAQKCHAARGEFEKLTADPDRQQDCWIFAAALETLGRLFGDIGQTPEAELVYRDAQVLWRMMVAKSNLEDHRWHLAENYDILAILLEQAGRLGESLESRQSAYAVWLKLAVEFNQEDRRFHLAVNCNAIGKLLRDVGRIAEAIEIYQQSLDVWKKLIVEFNRDDHRNHRTGTMIHLAVTLQTAGWGMEAKTLWHEAEVASREDLELQKQRLGNEHRSVEVSLGLLAQVLQHGGKLAEAETVWREELAVERKLSGNEHLWVANSLQSLATVLRDSAKWSEAEAMFREALAIRRKLLDYEHPAVATSLSWLGAILSDQGKDAEAESVCREELALLRKLPAEDPQLAVALAGLTRSLLAGQKFTEAEPLARECLAIREKKLPDNWQTFNARSLLGGSLLGQKKFVEAGPLLLSGYEGLKQREDAIPTGSKRYLRETILRLAELYEATGQSEKAAEWNRKVREFDQAEAAKKAATKQP